MSRIFEKFVRNYYIINYNSRHIWVGTRQFGVMKTVNTIYNRSITDITIENKRNNKVVIIDTKWCKAVLNERNKLSADNQMQIKEYVRDYMEEYGNENTYITGILLYAKPNIELDIESIEKDYLVLGKTEYGMICTKIIDLEKEFDKIKKKLDSIFMEYIA